MLTNMYTVNVIERWVPGVHNSILTNMYIVNAVERWIPGVHNSMLTNMYTVERHRKVGSRC